MSRVLTKKIKLRGISKNRVLYACVVIVIILLSLLLFDGNDSSADISPANRVDAVSKTSEVDSLNTKDATNNIIIKVAEAHKLLTSKAVVTMNKADIMVPPIIPVSTNNRLGLKTRSSITSGSNESTITTNYASQHAKSLIFSGVKSNNYLTPTTSPVIASAPVLSTADEVRKNTDYLQSELRSPLSIYELKAGSIIPATMINGLNSDLAGEVIAFVRSNVYDTVSRRYLLIPQGSRLVGIYDSHILYGQERVAVLWHRLIYPDGSSINLKAMPGSDLEGYSGFHDMVDNKYWRLFGTSFILGVITGAMQYSQNNINANNNNNPTIGQTMAGSLGQQLGQTGMSVTQKNLNVQPTIIIRPNYPFSIMITADMLLKPWRKM